jgi:hypothetical protein
MQSKSLEVYQDGEFRDVYFRVPDGPERKGAKFGVKLRVSKNLEFFKCPPVGSPRKSRQIGKAWPYSGSTFTFQLLRWGGGEPTRQRRNDMSSTDKAVKLTV